MPKFQKNNKNGEVSLSSKLKSSLKKPKKKDEKEEDVKRSKEKNEDKDTNSKEVKKKLGTFGLENSDFNEEISEMNATLIPRDVKPPILERIAKELLKPIFFSNVQNKQNELLDNDPEENRGYIRETKREDQINNEKENLGYDLRYNSREYISPERVNISEIGRKRDLSFGFGSSPVSFEKEEKFSSDFQNDSKWREWEPKRINESDVGRESFFEAEKNKYKIYKSKEKEDSKTY